MSDKPFFGYYSILGNEDHVIWRLHCVQRLGREMINSSLLASLPTCKAKLRSLFYAWNPNDCSRHMSVKANGFTVHRNNQPSSTDGVRGKIGMRCSVAFACITLETLTQDLGMGGMLGK